MEMEFSFTGREKKKKEMTMVAGMKSRRGKISLEGEGGGRRDIAAE